MNERLICLDIDGTLLDDGRRIPAPVKECLQKVFAMGIEIALVTGRGPVATELIERELGIPCIKACSAGTYILYKGRCVYERTMTPQAMVEIDQKIAAKYQLPLWIFRGRDWYVTGIDGYVEQEIRIIQHRPELTGAQALAGKWEKENIAPNKLLIAAAPEQIQSIQREMAGLCLAEVDAACSAENYLEIFPKGATKGTALLAICNVLGIKPEETISFGDQELDIPMLEAAGVGIAMGNAIGELKERADLVTGTNNEAGVAQALLRYLKLDGE